MSSTQSTPRWRTVAAAAAEGMGGVVRRRRALRPAPPPPPPPPMTTMSSPGQIADLQEAYGAEMAPSAEAPGLGGA